MVESGRYPAKATIGEPVLVGADVFTDGHDDLACTVRYRHEDDRTWSTHPMSHLGNDRWSGQFAVDRLGAYRFSIWATVDRFGTWRRELLVKENAGQAIVVELQVGAALVAETAARASRADRAVLLELAQGLQAASEVAARGDTEPGLALATAPALAELMARWPDPVPAASSDI